MTQQINLYQPELFEKRVPFSAIQMASVAAAIFLLVMVAGAVQHWRLSALTSELVRLQEHRDAAIQQINDYENRYPLQSPDPDLLRKVEEMSTIRQATLTLQQLLTGSQLGNRSGFSEHLTGLARQDLSTVWLRRIRFSAGGEQLLIEGSSSHAADVPLYLQRLTEQKIFTNCEFEHLQLKRAENASPVIDFLVQTTQEGDS